MRKRLILTGDAARKAACREILSAQDGWVFKLTPPAKTRAMEEKYHAMIGDVAKQHMFFGRLWDTEDVKRMLLDQFWRDTKEDPEFKDDWQSMGAGQVVPSLDGTGVVQLGAQSRRFTKGLGKAFITWLDAFGADAGIKWSVKPTVYDSNNL